jgi:hypothetical protein
MLEYLRVNHNNLVETEVVEKFNKSKVKKLIKEGIDIETGEVLDFVKEVTETKYTVKTAVDEEETEE